MPYLFFFGSPKARGYHHFLIFLTWELEWSPSQQVQAFVSPHCSRFCVAI